MKEIQKKLLIIKNYFKKDLNNQSNLQDKMDTPWPWNFFVYDCKTYEISKTFLNIKSVQIFKYFHKKAKISFKNLS